MSLSYEGFGLVTSDTSDDSSEFTSLSLGTADCTDRLSSCFPGS